MRRISVSRTSFEGGAWKYRWEMRPSGVMKKVCGIARTP
jgi:hypothetical protein